MQALYSVYDARCIAVQAHTIIYELHSGIFRALRYDSLFIVHDHDGGLLSGHPYFQSTLYQWVNEEWGNLWCGLITHCKEKPFPKSMILVWIRGAFPPRARARACCSPSPLSFPKMTLDLTPMGNPQDHSGRYVEEAPERFPPFLRVQRYRLTHSTITAQSWKRHVVNRQFFTM